MTIRRLPRGLRRLTRVAPIAVAATLLSSCSFIQIDNRQNALNPQGPFAREIDSLFWPTFWIATGIFALVMLAIIIAVIAFRDRGGDKNPKQVHGNAKLEVTWTVIPSLILAVIAVPTVRSVFNLTSCDPGAMQVNIVGHQWWFEFQYPDANVTTAGVLVIPTGTEVCATMNSADVIHNFWVPELMGKRYLVPGHTTHLRLEADAPGEFWAQCGEYCGLSHSLMRARVQALSPADFQAWLKAQQQPAPVPAPGTQAATGFELFTAKGCTACHSVTTPTETLGPAPDAFHGPNLTHFASRDAFAGASLPRQGQTHDQALKEWLANPPLVKPGSFMPNLGLTNDEIDALIAWLDTLK